MPKFGQIGPKGPKPIHHYGCRHFIDIGHSGKQQSSLQDNETKPVRHETSSTASDHTTSDLYDAVDLHMTDSTANLMGRSNPAGQLFCNSLGFDRGFQSIINKIELTMNMENICKGFLGM